MAIRSLNRSDLDLSAPPDREPLTLFEQDVPFVVKLDARDPVHQQLGVHVATGRGGANMTTRCVTVRLTDPRDPFFLYTLTMLEDDYGRFKEAQELNVDFGGFPKHFVSMMSLVSRSESGHFVEFVTDTTHSGKLRIVEKTEFRQLEVLTLHLAREGDVGQKRYLAERFIYFEQAFHRARAEADEESAAHGALAAELRASLEALRMERDDLRERLRAEASTALSAQQSTVAQVRDELGREMRRQQAQFDAERAALTQKLELQQQQAANDARALQSDLTAARGRVGTLEASEVHLQSQLRIAQETLKAQAAELDRLRRDNEQLVSYRASASKALTEGDLNAVSMSEQLKHLRASLQKREEECAEYRAQSDKRDGYVQVLSDQLRTAQEKLAAHEHSLQKAHHIIGTQLQQMRGLKDKQRALADQLGAKEQLLGEAQGQAERLKASLAHSAERIDHFQSAVSALKEQLQKAEDDKRVLAEELQSSKDALTHMYKTASSVTPRIHGYSNHSAVGSHLYSDFSKNMSVGGASGIAATSGAAAAAAATVPSGLRGVSSTLPSAAYSGIGGVKLGYGAAASPSALGTNDAGSVATSPNVAAFLPRPHATSGIGITGAVGVAAQAPAASSYFPSS